MPQFWKVAPPLTPAALFGNQGEKDDKEGHVEHNEAEEKDGHGDHAEYDDTTLKRAITKGIDPAGKPFDTVMPRWTIAEKDLADLIAFLRHSPSGNGH